ncbi:MAG: M17 family peptidase N-terminal domain-containing protein [Candidatus Sulfotelmatobacter sp.]
MKGISAYGSFVVVLTVLSVPCLIQSTPAQAQTTMAATQSKPAGIQIPNAPIPTRVLIQSPAETDTDLQIICLFESVPENTLHGSLVETNEKLKGLLDKIRSSSLFRGELGETVLIVPPVGSLTARNLLIIGLGDAQTFTPQRLELVGSIAYNESNRLRVTHPFFAPTVLDGGVSKYTTGQESEEFITGFLRAARTEKILQAAGADKGPVIQDLTYLAGPTRATDTQQGIERGLAAAGR